MPFSSFMFINFIIVAAWIALIPKKVDLVKLSQKLKAISLIPSNWENIEAYLPTNRKLKSIVRKFLLENSNEFLPVFMLSI